ncbi:MAG: hypothetical protein ACRDGM_19880 [bacterium]
MQTIVPLDGLVPSAKTMPWYGFRHLASQQNLNIFGPQLLLREFRSAVLRMAGSDS